MPAHPRDENGLTPQQAKVAAEIAAAGAVTPEVLEQVAARLAYGSTRPVNALVQKIREQLGCTRRDLPAELRRLGYAPAGPAAGGD